MTIVLQHCSVPCCEWHNDDRPAALLRAVLWVVNDSAQWFCYAKYMSLSLHFWCQILLCYFAKSIAMKTCPSYQCTWGNIILWDKTCKKQCHCTCSIIHMTDRCSGINASITMWGTFAAKCLRVLCKHDSWLFLRASGDNVKPRNTIISSYHDYTAEHTHYAENFPISILPSNTSKHASPIPWN